MARLLLLEEDIEGRECLARMLKMRGFSVLQSGEESDALDLISSSPDIKVVIAGASYRDRLEFFAEVREYRPEIPVVFLSNYCDSESKLRGLLYGAFSMSRSLNFYINMRPIGMNELEGLLRFIVHNSQSASMRNLVAA